MNTRILKTVLQSTAAVLITGAVPTSLPAQAPSAQTLPDRSARPAAVASQAKPETESESPSRGDDSSNSKRNIRLAKYLTGATFTGRFTVQGETTDPKPESYTILSCAPLAEDDEYRLKVKVRYGDVDGEFPMDLKILWAGSTPVITLDGVWIPGLGTFSSRVLLHDDRYAGTWQHGAKGGHLFGTIAAATK